MKMRFLITANLGSSTSRQRHAAFADKRVAFVVGNGAYKNVAALPNPAVDAKAMAKLLRQCRLRRRGSSNLTRDRMTEKLLDFGKKRKAPMSHCSSMPATASR